MDIDYFARSLVSLVGQVAAMIIVAHCWCYSPAADATAAADAAGAAADDDAAAAAAATATAAGAAAVVGAAGVVTAAVNYNLAMSATY